jgi:hypothetical protein
MTFASGAEVGTVITSTIAIVVEQLAAEAVRYYLKPMLDGVLLHLDEKGNFLKGAFSNYPKRYLCCQHRVGSFNPSSRQITTKDVDSVRHALPGDGHMTVKVGARQTMHKSLKVRFGPSLVFSSVDLQVGVVEERHPITTGCLRESRIRRFESARQSHIPHKTGNGPGEQRMILGPVRLVLGSLEILGRAPDGLRTDQGVPPDWPVVSEPYRVEGALETGPSL